MKKSVLSKHNLQLALLLAPGLVLYGVFNLVPLLGLPVLSLFNWSGIGSATFVGLENYSELFFNPYFSSQLINAFLRNIVFFIIIILFMLGLGTVLALLLSFRTFGSKTYRALFFLPYPMAGAAVAFLLDLTVRTKGPINNLLVKGLSILDKPYPFLGQEESALATLAFFYTWHRMGFAVLLICTAIIAVRVSLLEAAYLDGASKLQTIKAVIIPILMPTFVVITVIIMVDVFNNADYTLLLMGPEAGPLRSTDILGTFLFRTSFGASAISAQPNFGLAASIGLVTTVVILPAALFLVYRNARKDE